MTSTAAPDARPAVATWLLTALVAAGTLATSIYVPALPALTEELGADRGTAQLTLSLFLASLAIGQLAYGPVSDAVGRRGPLLAGLGLFVVGCVAAAFATSIEALIAARIVQGCGVCGGAVIARAMVRDLYAPKDAIRVMGTIAAALALAPAIGPSLGSLIHAAAGWRWIFGALGLAALALAAAALFRLPETAPGLGARRVRPGAVAASYAVVLGSWPFLRDTIAAASVFGGMFVYITGSPFLLMEQLGVSAAAFGPLTIVLVAGYFVGAMLARRFGPRLGVGATMRLGGVSAAVGGSALLGVIALTEPGLVAVLSAMFVYQIGVGLTLPPATTSAIGRFPERAGAASALAGFLQMGGATAGSLLVAAIDDATHQPMAALIAGCGAVTLALAFSAAPDAAERRDA